MTDRSYPSAAPPKKTNLLLGNLPPKQVGFGNAQVSPRLARVCANQVPWVTEQARVEWGRPTARAGHVGFPLARHEPAAGKVWTVSGRATRSGVDCLPLTAERCASSRLEPDPPVPRAPSARAEVGLHPQDRRALETWRAGASTRRRSPRYRGCDGQRRAFGSAVAKNVGRNRWGGALMATSPVDKAVSASGRPPRQDLASSQRRRPLASRDPP